MSKAISHPSPNHSGCPWHRGWLCRTIPTSHRCSPYILETDIAGSKVRLLTLINCIHILIKYSSLVFGENINWDTEEKNRTCGLNGRKVKSGWHERMDTTQEKSKDGEKHGWGSEIQGMQKKNMIPEMKKIDNKNGIEDWEESFKQLTT